MYKFRYFHYCWQEDYAQQQREKEKEKRAPLTQPKKEDVKKKAQMESLAMTNRMLQAAKTLERMVNQNIFDDISQGRRSFVTPSSMKLCIVSRVHIFFFFRLLFRL